MQEVVVVTVKREKGGMVRFTVIVMATQLPWPRRGAKYTKRRLSDRAATARKATPLPTARAAPPTHAAVGPPLAGKVGGREHDGAVEGQDHEHVGGPDGDAPDGGGEQAEEGSVVHGGERSVGDGPVPEHGREGTQVGGFLDGDPGAAELVGGQGEDGAGEEAVGAAEEGEEAGVGGGGGREGEVVVEDGAGEGVKVGGGGGAAGEGGR